MGDGTAVVGCGAVGDGTGSVVGRGDVGVAVTAGCRVGVAIVCGTDVGATGVGVGVGVGDAKRFTMAAGVALGNMATNTEEPANGVCLAVKASSSAIISARILSLSMGAKTSGACRL